MNEGPVLVGFERVRTGCVAAFLTFFDHNLMRVRGWDRLDLFGTTRAGSVAARGDWGMQVAKLWRSLLAVGAMSVLIGGGAHAQNLDQGKPAPKLFADGCATCHRSARGLAKGRFRLTLFLFLQKHYATSSSSAWALTSYLESVDTPQRGRSRAAAAKPSSPATRTSRSSMRPPASVPAQ